MNQDLIFSVADLLVKTFTNTNDAERRLAEVQLSDMAQNDEIYLQIMLSIITINHPSITTQVKNSAAVQIKKLVKTNDEERKLQSKYLFYIQNILAGLTSPNLVIQLRASLGYALTPIFSHENEEVVAYIFPLIFSNLNGNDDAILGSLRALRSVYNDVVHVPALLVYFRHLLDPMLSIVQRVTLGLRNGESNQDSADILSEICGFLTVVIEHFEITSRSSLAEIVQIQSFSALISEILTFVPSETPFGQTCLVSTLKHPLHIKLNQGKAQLLQGMNVVLQFISEHKELESQDTPFIHMIGGLIENLTRSLLLVVGRDEYEGYLSDNYIEEFFLETLILLSKLAQHNRFLAFFIQNSKGIIVEIIFSIIKAFSDDYETIETYPEEFVNSSLEICERQQSATYKTSAVELLQVLCQRIDGMLSFLVSFIYQVLYSTLSRTSQESFNYLTEFQTSKILNSNEIEKVEVCLLVLCCVSDAIISRKDLFVMIELLFRNFLGGIILANSSMIQHRLCLVIRYYLAFLFIGEKVKFTELVEFLLNNCNPNGKSKAVVQQAAETLVRVLEDEECMDRIEPLLETILNSLIGLIPFQNNKSFFESIQELLAQNITLVFPHLSSLISLLVQKIQSEISRLNDKAQKGKNKKSSIIMIKC